MQTGTQILIERMKTHPEEFVEGHTSKWGRVMDMANSCLPDEDLQALKQAYTQAKIDRFNEEVLRTLTGEREVEETIKYKTAQRYSTGFTDPRAVNSVLGNTLTIGSNGTSSVDLMPSAFGSVPRSQP